MKKKKYKKFKTKKKTIKHKKSKIKNSSFKFKKNKKTKKKNTKYKKSKIKSSSFKSKKNKKIKKKKNTYLRKYKKKNSLKSKISSKAIILKIIRIVDKIKFNFRFDFSLDQFLQSFFQGITNSINEKIDGVKVIIEEEKQRKKEIILKHMQKEKLEKIKRSKLEKHLALENKKKEFKEEIKLEKDRKKDLQKFIRLEQAEVRKEQVDKQRKFLQQIQLQKKIEQFSKREALEIQKLERQVLSFQREDFTGVQSRIDAIKQKYQSLRDQKIKERIEELGIETTDSDTRSELLEKERQYNAGRQKIEFALESYYRSMASCVFQLNKRWIPKKMSLLRVLDYRYERSEIFIKFDEDSDDKWLMLVYIKDNDPDAGIIVEDKTNPEKNISIEYKANEIFKFSDALVDSLTNLLDRERKKRKTN